MRALLRVGFAAACAVGAAGHAHAQSSSSPATQSSADGGSFLKSPIFLAQPGAITVNPHNDFAREGTGFNLRLVTVVPTSLPGFQFIVGAQFQPNGTSTRFNGSTTGNESDNRPAIFYGTVFALPPLNELFNNWFSFSVDPLGWYGPGGGNDKHHAYGNDFYLEGAVSFNFGRKLWSNKGWISGVAAYGLLDQQISNAPRNANGNRTYWNPNIMYGLTVPLAGIH
jgi:hypothetical protein